MPYRSHNAAYGTIIFLIVAFALAIRIWLACSALAVSHDAASRYLPMAQGWQDGTAKAFVAGLPPLYPILTGLLARLVGDVVIAGRVLSIAGGMMVLLFVFLMVRRLAGRWTACIALALVAFHPPLCEYSAEIGPDSLAAGLLAALVYAICAYLLTLSFWNVLLGGVSLAALCLIRPEGVLYAPLTLVALLFWPARQMAGHRLRRLGHVGILVAILVAVCIPRLISVHRQTGVWALDIRQQSWSARIWHAMESGQLTYGQWRLWARGGWPAVGNTLDTTGASFGPAGLIFGIYGLLAARHLRNRRIALLIPVFAVYGFLIIFVGNRILKRYLLGAAAIWQLWTAIGIVLLFLRVRLLLRKRYAASVSANSPCACLRAIPVAAGLVIAALQLPWVQRHPYIEFTADRRMGDWIAANLPPGTRILAMEPVPIWYGRAVKVSPPTFKPSRLTPQALASLTATADASFILVDTRGPAWCPNIWDRLEKGDWPLGHILHVEKVRKHTLYLLDLVTPTHPSTRPAPRPKRKPPRPPATQPLAATSAPATQPALRTGNSS